MEPKFYHKEKVKITKGFYTNYMGIITSYKKENDVIVYNINFENEELNSKNLTFYEHEIKLLGLIDKIKEFIKNSQQQKVRLR